jgi:hypothetical protein
MPMPANPFNRQIAFRFFFPRLNSGYTAYAHKFRDALNEATEFFAACRIPGDLGPCVLYINGEPASMPAAQAA